MSHSNNGFGITRLSEAMAYMSASQTKVTGDSKVSPQQSPDSSAHKDHPLALKSMELAGSMPSGLSLSHPGLAPQYLGGGSSENVGGTTVGMMTGGSTPLTRDGGGGSLGQSQMDYDDSADSDYSNHSQSDYSNSNNIDKVKLEPLDDVEKFKHDLLNFQWPGEKLRPDLMMQSGALEKFKEDLLKPGAFEKLYHNFHNKHPSLSQLEQYSSSSGDSNAIGGGSGHHCGPEQIPFVESTSNVPSSLPQDFHDLKYKTKPTKDKTCLVCGDKALGYNFNAISCESCKAFFRRNASKEIRGRCEGKCDVTVESRSYCKKCRLAKCFIVGMKRELILNDVQKNIRRQKIHENRLRRQGLPVTVLPGQSDTQQQQQQQSPSGSSTSSVDSAASSLTHVIASEIDPQAVDDLSHEAKDKIAEVKRAFSLSFDSPVNYDPKTAPSGTDFLNMADASVRRLVKMAKHLETFRQLDQEDQITLLKGAVVEVLILRSSKMFDSSGMSWQLQSKDGEQKKVSAMALQQGNGDNIQFFQQYQKFTTALLTVTKRDNVILMLVIVMTVLSPDRVNIKVKESVSAAQEQYANILKQYCEKKYPKEKPMFAKILQKLADIREINETHTKMLMHMKVDELGPLIVEIFNLSSR